VRIGNTHTTNTLLLLLVLSFHLRHLVMQQHVTTSASATAIAAVCQLVASTLGPYGRDIMVIDQVGDVVLSNDGATIVQHVTLEQPAARLLVQLARSQDVCRVDTDRHACSDGRQSTSAR
jgi:uncharacterized membrane protein